MAERRAWRGVPIGLVDSPTRGRPAPRPRGTVPTPPSEPVCNYCNTFASCCYCYAKPDALRAGLTTLILDHGAHNPTYCDGCKRLTGALDSEAAMRTACRRLAEIHSTCSPWECRDRQRLLTIQQNTP